MITHDPFIRRGRRVAIRHPQPDDADELIALHQAIRALHHPWVVPPLTPDQVATYLERCRRDDTAGFLVCRLPDQRMIGAINLSQFFYGSFQSAYMGYYLGAGHTGSGSMTAAIALVLDHAFDTLGLHRIEANIQPANHASLAVVQRLGFTQEGYSRRYLKINGVWCDHTRWAMLAEDWADLRPQP
jgi:ribosomal-protein-alanine N-acetyltransferase